MVILTIMRYCAFMNTLGDWVRIAPWKSRHVLLIALTAGVTESSNGVVGKREILADATDETLLIAAWSGDWSTTARVFDIADRVAVRKSLE